MDCTSTLIRLAPASSAIWWPDVLVSASAAPIVTAALASLGVALTSVEATLLTTSTR